MEYSRSTYRTCTGHNLEIEIMSHGNHASWSVRDEESGHLIDFGVRASDTLAADAEAQAVCREFDQKVSRARAKVEAEIRKIKGPLTPRKVKARLIKIAAEL